MTDETPPRRPTPKLTPGGRPILPPEIEARLLPVDRQSAAAYTAAEEAVANLAAAREKQETGTAKVAELDEALSDGRIALPLQITESIFYPVKKPDSSG